MDDSDNMMDDAEKMDLALNCDFESSLFSCWADPPESDNGGGFPNRVDPSSSSQHNQLPGSRKENNDDDDDEKAASDSDGFLRLPSFSMVDESSTSLKSDQQQHEQQGMDMMIAMMKADSDEQQATAAAASTSDPTQPDSFWQIPNQHQGLLSADQLAAALLPFSQQLAMAYGGAMNHHSSTGVVNTISDSESNTQSSKNRAAPSTTLHHHHHHHQRHHQQQQQHGNGNVASTAQTNSLLAAAAVAASNNTAINAANIASLAQHHQDAAASTSMNNSTTTDSSTSATNHNNNNIDAADSQHLHLLGIQSSASCPPNVLGTAAAAAAAGLNLSAFFPFAAAAFGGNMEAMGFGGGGAPFMFPNVAQPQLQQQQAMPQQVSQLQQQPMASAAAAAAGVNHSNPSSFVAPPQQQSAAAPSKEVASKPSKSKKSQSPTPSQPKAKGKANRRTGANSSARTEELPPFYLFDAPVELRNNFMQSQRMHGLPVSQDSNSLHYGMSVNGFHPQLNAQANPVVMPPFVHLVDARHCKRSECSVKNEREQRRTQKIAELIDQLRINMEIGGWKGEMRSKFHILSTCADYMKHLMESNADREEAVKQARSDLEMKERELEEDRAVQGRSDPESVASSLTMSSRASGSNGDSGGDDSRDNRNNNNSSSNNSNNKRKSPDSDQEQESTNKKSRQESEHDPNAISSDDSGNGSQGTEDKVISLGKTASSVSDITDSNRGSSNSGSDGQAGSSNSGSDGQTGEEKSNNERAVTNSCMSSDAAVAAGEGSHGQEIDPLDMVIRERHPHHHHHHHHDGHKKRNAEAMSGESNFELDYEEVFNQSNIPQLLSTSAGRIIAWNKFFLKATGLTPEEIECMTIFTLVKPDKLSNLFQIVATALRGDGSQERNNETNTGYSSGQTDGEPTSSQEEAAPSTTRSWNYATMTLPCVTFPNTKLRRQTTSDLSKELFMTVTLMADEDPRKRCFHCVFTDCPGTNGALGSITPELLAMLFNQPKKPNDSFEVKRNRVERTPSQYAKQPIEDIDETEAENSS